MTAGRLLQEVKIKLFKVAQAPPYAVKAADVLALHVGLLHMCYLRKSGFNVATDALIRSYNTPWDFFAFKGLSIAHSKEKRYLKKK